VWREVVEAEKMILDMQKRLLAGLVDFKALKVTHWVVWGNFRMTLGMRLRWRRRQSPRRLLRSDSFGVWGWGDAEDRGREGYWKGRESFDEIVLDNLEGVMVIDEWGEIVLQQLAMLISRISSPFYEGMCGSSYYKPVDPEQWSNPSNSNHYTYCERSFSISGARSFGLVKLAYRETTYY
jgi:hypothetical protein